MKISFDLCDTCQQNNIIIMKPLNYTEEEKSNVLKQQNHLASAKECRAYMYYKQRNVRIPATFRTHSVMSRSSPETNWRKQYTFDYAQNALVSHSPQEVGPIYLKTPRKCHLFGICAESVPQKVSHLELTSKGANETICSLNHYFDYENAIGYKNLNLHY